MLEYDSKLRDFLYHTVDVATAERMAHLRENYYWLAKLVLDLCPKSREQSLALTALEESCMRAIQCVAVEHGEPTIIGAVHLPGINDQKGVSYERV